MHEKLIYLGLCAATIVFAAHFPLRERRAGMLLAIGLLANWLICEMTYLGVFVPVRGTDVWSLADATYGIVALALAWWRPWGWALWAISVIQCGFHQLLQLNVMLADTYLWWLDKLLLASIAVFIIHGGRGIAERIAALVDRRRDGVLARIAARERAP